jgi:cytochrome c oxidase subunit 2
LKQSFENREQIMKLKLALVSTIFMTFFSTAALAQDIEAGRVLYGVCSACHGPNGEGLQALNGPRLAGQEAWYTERQLQNFKSGARGSDPRDVYGQQMAPMAQTLTTDQAIKDVAAYIESLGG